MVRFFRNTWFVNLLSFEGKQESTVSFHEKRAAQTRSSSVNITTLGTERIRVLSVWVVFQRSPLSEEEQAAAQQLTCQTVKEMKSLVEEVIRPWIVGVVETLNPE